MSKILSFFNPKQQQPKAPPASTVPESEPKKSKKASLLALRATSSGGVLGEANVGRRKILV